MYRRLVIPDIHGCLNTFEALIEKVALTKEDSLFLLGDYIDRGPNSSGVIDYILKLKSEGYNLFPIMGNHEQDILDAFDEYDAATFKFYVKRFKSLDLLDSEIKIKEPYLSFMKGLPYYIQLADYYLVHGGIDFSKEDPFDKKEHLLVLRKNTYLKEKAGGRKVVYGHHATNLSEIEMAVKNQSSLIPLDNGCIYNKPHKIYDHRQMGNLLCLNLDTFELISNKNLDA